MTPTEREAWNSQLDRCDEEAMRALETTAETFPPTLEDLREVFIDMETEIRTDRRLALAEDDWRRCLVAAGFDYDDRDTIHSEITDQLWGLVEAARETNGEIVVEDLARIQQGELATALADLECKLSTIDATERSEERRVGKESRSRWSPYH